MSDLSTFSHQYSACSLRYCEALVRPPVQMFVSGTGSSPQGQLIDGTNYKNGGHSVTHSSPQKPIPKLNIEPPKLDKWPTTISGLKGQATAMTELQNNQKLPYDVKPIELNNCGICASYRPDSVIIVCDSCNVDFHLSCLELSQEEIPSGRWDCPYCFDWDALPDITENSEALDWRKAYEIFIDLHGFAPHISRQTTTPPFWLGRPFLLRSGKYQTTGLIVGYEDDLLSLRTRTRLLRKSSAFFLGLGKFMYRGSECDAWYQNGKSVLITPMNIFVSPKKLATTKDNVTVEKLVRERIVKWDKMKKLTYTHPLVLSSRDEAGLPALQYEDSPICCPQLFSGVDRIKMLQQLKHRGVKRSRDSGATMKCELVDDLSGYWQEKNESENY